MTVEWDRATKGKCEGLCPIKQTIQLTRAYLWHFIVAACCDVRRNKPVLNWIKDTTHRIQNRQLG